MVKILVVSAAVAASLMFYLAEGQPLQSARQSPIPVQRDGMPSGKVGGLASASVADLTRKSDVVCVGIVSSLTANGTATVFSGGNSYTVDVKLATISVDRYVKGTDGPAITTEVYNAQNLDLEGQDVLVGQRGIFFLKDKSGTTYKPTLREFVFAPALATAPASGAQDVDGVMAELSQVVASSSASLADRQLAIYILGETLQLEYQAAAMSSLRDEAGKTASPVRVDAAVVLLQNDDVSAVDFVADRVLQTSPPLDGTTQQHINTALLGRLKNPLAIPALIRLLGSTDATVRRGAAASLRRTQSQGALEPLARTGLEDADQTVRYFAVMGLAELVGDYQHGPAITVYRQNESMYLDYWRTWRAGMFP